MLEVSQIAPLKSSVDASLLVNQLRDAQHTLQPFDLRVLNFIEDLSKNLRRHHLVRDYPALAALAWWIRPTSIETLERHWNHLISAPNITRSARGLVFHVPPTNVDTMFVYSWLLSALAGNSNLIRLSGNQEGQRGVLFDVLLKVMADHPTISDTTSVVTYGHEREFTEIFSLADVRVIWGGDETVQKVREVQIPPRSTELTFSDRYSFSLLNSEVVLSMSDEELTALSKNFFNDAFWFDQLGCSSPRMILWLGEKELSTRASELLFPIIQELARNSAFDVETSTVIAKLVHSATMLSDGCADAINWSENHSTFTRVKNFNPQLRNSPGGGLFYYSNISEASEIKDFISKKDQTITYHGFSQDELREIATMLGARGIDRIVPVGQALNFYHFWDGFDLLERFSRAVQII